MSGFLLSLLFSTLGIWVGVIGFVIAGITVRLLGLPQWLVIGLIALAPVHAYSGSIWQMAMSECQERVEREVRAEQKRQELAGQRVVARSEAELNRVMQERDEALAELAKESAALPERPACRLSSDDADWINR